MKMPSCGNISDNITSSPFYLQEVVIMMLSIFPPTTTHALPRIQCKCTYKMRVHLYTTKDLEQSEFTGIMEASNL